MQVLKIYKVKTIKNLTQSLSDFSLQYLFKGSAERAI